MTTFLSLEEIKQQAFDIAVRVGIGTDLVEEEAGFNLQPWEKSIDASRVEVHSDGYHYIYEERGVIGEDKITTDIQELLYWIFKSVTSSLASNFIPKQHIYPPHWEYRRKLWRKQLELLGRISPEFKGKRKKEITEILSDAPFDEDGLPNNMDYEEWDTERSNAQ